MSNLARSEAGAVGSLWRYPVKSMRGEELSESLIGEQGLLGDRAYALVDGADGKVATAKNPKKWPNLFAFQATLEDGAARGPGASSLRIVLPDGRVVTGEQADLDQVLSKELRRPVTLAATEQERLASPRPLASAPPGARSEGYWPDIEGLAHRETVTDFELPAGTFFDCATVHLLTTASLDRLRRSPPEGPFEIPRFRPNIVVEPAGEEEIFVENTWVGRVLEIGDDVRLAITKPCGRCVMTTLPQGDLLEDRDILRAIARENRARLGVYAAVLRGGTIHRGDPVRLSAS